MSNLRNEKLLAKKSSQRFSGISLLAARLGIWLAVACGVVLLLWGLQYAARHVFFSQNPHYTLRAIEVEVVSGPLTAEEITARLDLRVESDNLYAIDLAATRSLLKRDPVVRQVEVRRRLPGTLVVRIWGRTPVARMRDATGTMIDSDGFVLPPASSPEHKVLPIITPFDPATPFAVGDQVNAPIVRDALSLLNTLATKPNGHWLEISRINMQESEDVLMVYLRANPERRIRDNAVIIMDASDIDTSVERALTVIARHSEGNQPIGFMDVTLDRVPVRP